MSLYRRLVSPLLFRFDAERMHEATLRSLELAQRSGLGRLMLARIAGTVPARPVSALGLSFPNVLGLAAGYDKDARVIEGLVALGFGHIEVGTLTPRPQIGNPTPRVFRLPEDGALINRMGFPNRGVAAALPALETAQRGGAVIGVSLGKQKETPLAEALNDYVAVMRSVYILADYLAVNVSSPNTPGLRELQGGRYLGDLLVGIQAENERLAAHHQVPARPWLVKIAPDLSWAELDEILAAASAAGAGGVIATNTTLSREGLASVRAGETGGLSGLPLRERSRQVVRYIRRQAQERLTVIGVGGIRTVDDVEAMIEAGADLVQVYTGLVYEGPGLPGRVLRALD